MVARSTPRYRQVPDTHVGSRGTARPPHAVRTARRPSAVKGVGHGEPMRSMRRGWRRRGRRGQVAAVATVLGLLLIVTMVANFLSTQLPAQMQVNDANHTLVVEDQVSRFAATLQAAAGVSAVDAALSQPVSLGSVGDPPFAPADGSVIGPGTLGSGIAVSFSVNGGSTYAPPSVGAAGGTTTGASCTTGSTSLTCSTTGHKVVWNFTSSSPTSYSVSTSGGPYYLNFSTSGSTIAATVSSSAPDYYVIIGNNDTLTFTISGSSDVVHVVMVGNNDEVTFAAGSWSSSTIQILFVGNFDSLVTGSQSLSSSRLLATFYGSNDTTQLGTTSATGSSVGIYYNGFVPTNPTSSCPVDNLAAHTDSVSTTGSQSGSGTYTVTFNDTSVGTGSAPPSPWAGTYGEPTPFACPFVVANDFSQKSSGAGGASFSVLLRNSYIPQGVVAFDQGAVVYAQPNGIPLMLLGPVYTFVHGTLTLWVPVFLTRIGTEVGTGTAELTAHLVSLLNVSLPAGGYALSGTTSLAITTPYALAWQSYLSTSSSTLAGDAVCAPAKSTACTGPFQFNGPMGTVYVNVTATALALQIATFSIGVS